MYHFNLNGLQVACEDVDELRAIAGVSPAEMTHGDVVEGLDKRTNVAIEALRRANTQKADMSPNQRAALLTAYIIEAGNEGITAQALTALVRKTPSVLGALMKPIRKYVIGRNMGPVTDYIDRRVEDDGQRFWFAKPQAYEMLQAFAQAEL